MFAFEASLVNSTGKGETIYEFKFGYFSFFCLFVLSVHNSFTKGDQYSLKRNQCPSLFRVLIYLFSAVCRCESRWILDGADVTSTCEDDVEMIPERRILRNPDMNNVI